MARVRIEGQGLGALIRNTRDDAPAAIVARDETVPAQIALRLEAAEAEREAASERARRAEADLATLRRESEERRAAMAHAETALAAEREETLERLERREREGEAKVAEMADRLASLTRERDHLRRTIDTELPQGEAKGLLVTALFEKGGEHERRGNLLDAFHLYRRVLRLDPAHVDALLRVATIYYSGGLLVQAVEALRGVVELDPSRTKVREQLAVIEEMARRKGLAITGR